MGFGATHARSVINDGDTGRKKQHSSAQQTGADEQTQEISLWGVFSDYFGASYMLGLKVYVRALKVLDAVFSY